MDNDLAIDDWAREIASREAVAVRDAVRDAVLSGDSCAAALNEVRRRMARLTPEQHELMIAAIVEADETAA